MALTDRQRLRKLERQILSGKSPYLRSPLPGAAALLAKYKIDPESMFLPNPDKSDEENKSDRRRFNYKRQYQRDRNRVGRYTANQRSDEPKSGEDDLNFGELNYLKQRLADELINRKK